MKMSQSEILKDGVCDWPIMYQRCQTYLRQWEKWDRAEGIGGQMEQQWMKR